MAKNPTRNIRICGNQGRSIDTWMTRYGHALEPYSKQYIRTVVEIGKSRGLDHINVTGFRTPRDQCLAIYSNWKRRYIKGGSDLAIRWACRVYGKNRGPKLHKKYHSIYHKKWSFDAYVRDFIRRNSHKASHSNGRAFDVRPIDPLVDSVLHAALKYPSAVRYGRGIVPESDHYHVQLSPPNTYINFSEEEAMIIEVTVP